jgi:hypothetical protein
MLLAPPERGEQIRRGRAKGERSLGGITVNASLIWIGLGVAVAMTMSSQSISATPINAAAGQALANRAPMVELVQHGYNRRRYVNRSAQDAHVNKIWSRMGVEVETDGTILLPGIMTNRRGTWVTGAPRSRTTNSGRLGVGKGGMGGRLTGGTPKVRRH